MPIGVVPPSSGLAGDLSGVNHTPSVAGAMPSGRAGWVDPRIEHTESTESSYSGIPDEIPVGRRRARGYGDSRGSLPKDTRPRTAHGSCILEHYRIESVVRQGCPPIHQGNCRVVGRDPPASSGRKQSNQDSVSERSEVRLPVEDLRENAPVKALGSSRGRRWNADPQAHARSCPPAGVQQPLAKALHRTVLCAKSACA